MESVNGEVTRSDMIKEVRRRVLGYFDRSIYTTENGELALEIMDHLGEKFTMSVHDGTRFKIFLKPDAAVLVDLLQAVETWPARSIVNDFIDGSERLIGEALGTARTVEKTVNSLRMRRDDAVRERIARDEEIREEVRRSRRIR
jgi:hypothetical protein